MQGLAYNIVKDHFEDISDDKEPLRLIINSVAGTGKSYVINAIHNLLGQRCALITAPTGKASFNIGGTIIHSLLTLPVGPRGNKDLTSQSLTSVQQKLNEIECIIVDDYLLLGQTAFGWIDRRCIQATIFHDKILGGISFILVGDPAQLPPVADKPFYHAKPSSIIGEQGHHIYSMFEKIVKLTAIHRVGGSNPEQERLKDLLSRLRKGESRTDDWKLFLSRQPTHVTNLADFDDAVRLDYGKQGVANFSHEKLINLQQPVAHKMPIILLLLINGKLCRCFYRNSCK